MKPTSVSFGLSAERRVYQMLHSRGVQARRVGVRKPYDLLIDGVRVEIKTSSPHHRRGSLIWFFNLQRNGKLREGQVDAYLLRLEGVPYSKAPIHLMLPAPLGRKTMEVSFRSLLNGAGAHVERFKQFVKKHRVAKGQGEHFGTRGGQLPLPGTVGPIAARRKTA